MSNRKQQRTIAIDFDGVLHRYRGYRDGAIDGPIAGARSAIAHLEASGATVVVFTTRDGDLVRAWLAKHNFPQLEVTDKKRPFWLILDDRAVAFDGVWSEELLSKMLNFRPYWLGGNPAPGEPNVPAQENL